MRLLRYSCAAALAISLGCVPAPIVIDDDDTATSSTSGMPTTTTTAPVSMDTSTSDDPSADDTSTGGSDTSGSGTAGSTTDDGGQGQACNNGAIEGTEQCDCGGEFCTPAGLNGAMCAGLVNPLFPDRVYTGGILDCNMASCQFSFDQCSWCGDTVLNGNEICELDADPGPSCQQLGQGTDTTPLECGNDCQWDTTCCPNPPPKECLKE